MFSFRFYDMQSGYREFMHLPPFTNFNFTVGLQNSLIPDGSVFFNYERTKFLIIGALSNFRVDGRCKGEAGRCLRWSVFL